MSIRVWGLFLQPQRRGERQAAMVVPKKRKRASARRFHLKLGVPLLIADEACEFI